MLFQLLSHGSCLLHVAVQIIACFKGLMQQLLVSGNCRQQQCAPLGALCMGLPAQLCQQRVPNLKLCCNLGGGEQ